ncbi:hypothetical protein BH10PSE18_BH10PSE18_36960 [soil metagenome]
MVAGSIPSKNDAVSGAWPALGTSPNPADAIVVDNASPATSYLASSTAPFGGLPHKQTTHDTRTSQFSAHAEGAETRARTLREDMLSLPIFHTRLGLRNLFNCKPRESADETLFKHQLNQFAERLVGCFNHQPPDLDAAREWLPAEFRNLTRARDVDTVSRTEQVRVLVTTLIEKGKIKPRGQDAVAQFMASLERHCDLTERFPCHIPDLVLNGGLQEAFAAGGWKAVEPLMATQTPNTSEWNKSFEAMAGVLPELFRAKAISKKLYLEMNNSLSDFHRELQRAPDVAREEQDWKCGHLLTEQDQQPAKLPLLSDLVKEFPVAKDTIGWHPFADGRGGVAQTTLKFLAEDVAGGTAIVRKDLPDGGTAFDIFQEGRLITNLQDRQILLDWILEPDLPTDNVAASTR